MQNNLVTAFEPGCGKNQGEMGDGTQMALGMQQGPWFNCENFLLGNCSTACQGSRSSSPWSWRRQPSRNTPSQSSSPCIMWLRVLMMPRRKWGEVATEVGQELLGPPDLVRGHWFVALWLGAWTLAPTATVWGRQLPPLCPFPLGDQWDLISWLVVCTCRFLQTTLPPDPCFSADKSGTELSCTEWLQKPPSQTSPQYHLTSDVPHSLFSQTNLLIHSLPLITEG